MRRSLNEVYRICQKAAEGAGVPAGLDADAARNTAWLVARGFAVLDDFAVQLNDDGSACSVASADSDTDALDATGRPGALLAPSLVDLLIARAAHRGGPLAVTGLSAPIHLLPAAAAYRDDGWCFQFLLFEGNTHRYALETGTAGIRVLGPFGAQASSLAQGDRFDVAANCSASVDTLPAPAFDTLMTSDDLAALEALSLSHGVDIQPAVWQRLQALAGRILVPATEESRLRGAGSTASDNE